MPPLPPPNTLAQLEEARRRLEEVSKPSKQRYEFQSTPFFNTLYAISFEKLLIDVNIDYMVSTSQAFNIKPSERQESPSACSKWQFSASNG